MKELLKKAAEKQAAITEAMIEVATASEQEYRAAADKLQSLIGVYTVIVPEKPEKRESTPNEKKLVAFCTKIKNKEGVNVKSLKKFYEFYMPRAVSWKGEFKPEILWEKWSSTEW